MSILYLSVVLVLMLVDRGSIADPMTIHRVAAAH